MASSGAGRRRERPPRSLVVVSEHVAGGDGAAVDLAEGVVELRDYQRESYQFRIKLGRLRQLRLEGGGAITQQNYH